MTRLRRLTRRLTLVAVIGALLNFAVTLSLTPLCAVPSAESRDMVDQVREPEMIEGGPRVPGL